MLSDDDFVYYFFVNVCMLVLCGTVVIIWMTEPHSLFSFELPKWCIFFNYFYYAGIQLKTEMSMWICVHKREKAKIWSKVGTVLAFQKVEESRCKWHEVWIRNQSGHPMTPELKAIMQWVNVFIFLFVCVKKWICNAVCKSADRAT